MWRYIPAIIFLKKEKVCKGKVTACRCKCFQKYGSMHFITLHWTFEVFTISMKNLNVALLQMQPKWEDKATNMGQVEHLLAKIPGDTQLAILPEMFSTGFSMNADDLAETMDGPSVQQMRAWAMKYRKIIAGSLIISENNQYYNRLVWMQPDGHFYYYDKAHLFGKAGEDKVYSFGTKRLIVSVNGWRILLQTCYDLRFPVWARQTDNLYDVLINVAHWPEKRIKAWDALLTARAIENQAYVLGCNVCGKDGNGIEYNGHSQALDYEGNVLWTSDQPEQIGLVALEKQALTDFRSSHNFLADRDRFIILD